MSSTARDAHIEPLNKLRMIKICQEAKGPVVTKKQKIMKKRVLCLRFVYIIIIYKKRI